MRNHQEGCLKLAGLVSVWEPAWDMASYQGLEMLHFIIVLVTVFCHNIRKLTKTNCLPQQLPPLDTRIFIPRKGRKNNFHIALSKSPSLMLQFSKYLFLVVSISDDKFQKLRLLLLSKTVSPIMSILFKTYQLVFVCNIFYLIYAVLKLWASLRRS